MPIEYNEDGGVLLISDVDPNRTRKLRSDMKVENKSAVITAFFLLDVVPEVKVDLNVSTGIN